MNWAILGIIGAGTGWLYADALATGHPVAIMLAIGGTVLCILGVHKVVK